MRSRKNVPILYSSELLDDPQNQDDGDRHSERNQKAVVFLSVFRFGRLCRLLLLFQREDAIPQPLLLGIVVAAIPLE